MKLERIFGYDFPITKEPVTSISVESTGGAPDFSSGVVRGTEFFMQGLTADTVKKLKNGEAYLKFWIEAIKHTIPTANNKLYGYDEFGDGLNTVSFQRQLSLGGVPGEAEHPMIRMENENPDSQMNIYNNMARVTRFEPNNISHWITAYKRTPEATYFEIKTNPDNPIIVNHILAGRKPAFSIRTRGDFETDPSTGVIRARRLEVLGIDFVSNPANADSYALPSIKMYDCADTNTGLELNLLPKTGTESFGFESMVPAGAKLYYNPNIPATEALSCMKIVLPGETKDTSIESADAFDKSFDLLGLSIF